MRVNVRRLSLLFGILMGFGCAGAGLRRSRPLAATSAVREAPIVLVVVLDQLGSDVLADALPYLSSDGAIRRGIAQGRMHRVRFAYATTYTAPGHAAVVSGASPFESGIIANSVWDRAREKTLPIVDDGEHEVFGVDGAYASPAVLRVDTVVDVLERSTGGRARTASVSLKRRAAVLSGGKRPDVAVWYEPAAQGFTTSSYYAEQRPAWLAAWAADHPVDAFLETWELSDAAAMVGEDAAPGEGDWLGLGTTFPHDFRSSRDPYQAFRLSPGSNDALLSVARSAVEHLGMGDDDVPDLLMVSVSSTDYIGHVFGPSSWEYVDNLMRVDRALGRFVADLQSRAPVYVLITSDHGVAPLPETMGDAAGRIVADDVEPTLERILGGAFGANDWVSAFVPPYVYLTAAARDPAMRPKIVERVKRELSAWPSIWGAYDVEEAVSWGHHHDALHRALARSIHLGHGADILIVPHRGFVFDEGAPLGCGTNHGTPWSYDRDVPVIFWGPGIDHGATEQPLAQRRVAATIAAMLGITPPNDIRSKPLAGIASPRSMRASSNAVRLGNQCRSDESAGARPRRDFPRNIEHISQENPEEESRQMAYPSGIEARANPNW